MSDHDVTRSVGALRRNALGEIERWDGRKWVTAPRISDVRVEPPVVETVLAGVDAIERREQLARDVAHEWAGIVDAGLLDEVLPSEVAPDLVAALDRLAAAYEDALIDRRTGGGPTG